nr:hypothetical protein [Pandoravirus aubagnensis]
MHVQTRASRQTDTSARRPEVIAQHFTHACDLDVLCALDAMARVAEDDDTLDLWSACARQVNNTLAIHVASNHLLVEIMAQYPETTAGRVVEARDFWYGKITESRGERTALNRTLAVLDALDELARGVVDAIDKQQACALEQQAKEWAHARRTRLFWVNVDAATLRIDESYIDCKLIRDAYAVMRDGTFGNVMAASSTNFSAVVLLCGIIMDLGDVLGSADAMAALGVAIERVCMPSDCAIEGSSTE